MCHSIKCRLAHSSLKWRWQHKFDPKTYETSHLNEYEDTVEILVTNKFKEIGVKLISFSCPLEFSKKVTEKIDQRNEVNTNIGVLDQKIAEQKKTNELEELKTHQMIIKSRGITQELLQQQFIEKWDGSAPIYGSAPFFIKPINK